MEKKKYTNLERLFDACGSAYESHLSPTFLYVFIVAAIGFFPSYSVIEALSVSLKYKKKVPTRPPQTLVCYTAVFSVITQRSVGRSVA